jgi:hypothetical protein
MLAILTIDLQSFKTVQMGSREQVPASANMQRVSSAACGSLKDLWTSYFLSS